MCACICLPKPIVLHDSESTWSHHQLSPVTFSCQQVDSQSFMKVSWVWYHLPVDAQLHRTHQRLYTMHNSKGIITFYKTKRRWFWLLDFILLSQMSQQLSVTLECFIQVRAEDNCSAWKHYIQLIIRDGHFKQKHYSKFAQKDRVLRRFI